MDCHANWQGLESDVNDNVVIFTLGFLMLCLKQYVFCNMKCKKMIKTISVIYFAINSPTNQIYTA